MDVPKNADLCPLDDDDDFDDGDHHHDDHDSFIHSFIFIDNVSWSNGQITQSHYLQI